MAQSLLPSTSNQKFRRSILVDDVQKTAEFYREFLGFELEEISGDKNSGMRAILFKTDRNRIEILDHKYFHAPQASNDCKPKTEKALASSLPGLKKMKLRLAVKKQKKVSSKCANSTCEINEGNPASSRGANKKKRVNRRNN